MINVSNSFKKAIKNDEREIYGYVNVKYQNKNYTKQVTQIPDNIDTIKPNGIINGSKLMTKYATLENNYTLLDGSFMVYNENKIVTNGFISNDLFENINDNTITITNNSTTTTSKGITIYFKENLPFDFTVTITDVNNNVIVDNVVNNQSYNYQYIFPDETIISTVTINITSVEFPDNRLRIAYIDFNLGDLYENSELISFDVTEELDLLEESIPINTCTIRLNNYSDNGNKFDPINPKGLTKYLTDDVTLEPYIGVLTEDNGVEYVKMGTFYLNNWSSDSDGNTTFDGSSVIAKLTNINIPDKGGFFAVSSPQPLGYYLTQNTDYSFKFVNSNYGFTNRDIETSNLLEYIRLWLPFNSVYISDNNYEFRKFFVDRYNTVRLAPLNTNIVDTISRNLLKGDVDYHVKNRITELTITYKSISLMTTTQRERLINDTHQLFTTEEYVWYKIEGKQIWDQDPSFSYNVVSGSGSASLIDKSAYFMVVKYTGTIGSKISVNYTDVTQLESKSIKESTVSLSSDRGDNVSIDISKFGYAYDEYLQLIQTYYKNMDKQYKIEAKTMGDPSLVIGDSISIQTRYNNENNGYKNMIITKQKFTFDGGLSCEIEGVGD